MTRSKNKKTIFLFGPTAVGKTDLLCRVFSSGFEIVNADSVQVYKQLDIGSAKVDKEGQKAIPHHLVDILEPWEKYSTGEFLHLADLACEKIRANGNIPVLCGGTAFYFKNFLYGLSDAPPSDPEIRQRVAEKIEQDGLQKSYDYLGTIDPKAAQRINPNDSYRISRAIEVFLTCGKPLSSFEVPSQIRDGLEVLIIGLERDRQELKERIRKRVQIMFDQGIVDEIRKLLVLGANSSWQSMQGIGYREFFKAMESGEDSIPLIADKIVSNSIHYAKRQMTFFRSCPNVHWVNAEDIDTVQNLVSHFVAE